MAGMPLKRLSFACGLVICGCEVASEFYTCQGWPTQVASEFRFAAARMTAVVYEYFEEARFADSDQVHRQ
jgi:hypothetical protein